MPQPTPKPQPSADAVLDALFAAIRAQVAQGKAEHPHDVLGTALTVTEAAHLFVENLPSAAFFPPPASPGR